MTKEEYIDSKYRDALSELRPKHAYPMSRYRFGDVRLKKVKYEGVKGYTMVADGLTFSGDVCTKVNEEADKWIRLALGVDYELTHINNSPIKWPEDWVIIDISIFIDSCKNEFGSWSDEISDWAGLEYKQNGFVILDGETIRYSDNSRRRYDDNSIITMYDGIFSDFPIFLLRCGFGKILKNIEDGTFIYYLTEERIVNNYIINNYLRFKKGLTFDQSIFKVAIESELNKPAPICHLTQEEIDFLLN